MTKLKNKTFMLLFSILSIFVIISMFFYNYNLYHNEETRLIDEVMRIDSINRDEHSQVDNNNVPMFTGIDAYLVSVDINGDVLGIENYTQNKVSISEIKKILRNNKVNIDNLKDIRAGVTGNLYFDNYVFSLNKEGNLIVVKNDVVKSNLDKSLVFSLMMFVLFEIVIILISKILTSWLVKPVEETFLTQKNFIYDASHELKTPIAIILASAETLEKNPKEKKWLNNIKSETERMEYLVKKMLQLSKTENINKKELSLENLSKIVKKRSLTFESLAFEQGIKIKDNIEEDIMYKCDPEQIKEVVNVLVDNAIKHSEKKATVKINLYKEKNDIILDVINEGKEIPVLERKKIFDRFYRGDKSRNRNENRYGLGLAIAKNIVESYGGKILVNCKGGYTTFSVKL